MTLERVVGILIFLLSICFSIAAVVFFYEYFRENDDMRFENHISEKMKKPIILVSSISIIIIVIIVSVINI